MNSRKLYSYVLATSALLSLSVIGSSATAEEKGGGDLRASAQNPISSLISLPFKLTFDEGASNGNGTILNINPVVPVTVGDWNIVNRALIPLADVDGAIVGPNNPNPQGGAGSAGSWRQDSRQRGPEDHRREVSRRIE